MLLSIPYYVIVVALVSGGSDSDTAALAAGGILFLPTVLMILFRHHVPASALPLSCQVLIVPVAGILGPQTYKPGYYSLKRFLGLSERQSRMVMNDGNKGRVVQLLDLWPAKGRM